jgi:preprotein translocase subunit SecD
VDVPMNDTGEANRIASEVAGSLDLDPIDVTSRLTSQDSGTVEVYTRAVSTAEFRSALEAAGVETQGVSFQDGVTTASLEEAEGVLTQKINRGGLTGGGASLTQTATGEEFLVIEVPNVNRTEVFDLVNETGRVQVVATFPVQGENGTTYRNVSLLTQGDFAGIGQPTEQQGQAGAYVQVTLRRGEVAENFSSAMNSFGFTGTGVENCRWQTDRSDPGYCLKTVLDGETVYAAGMDSSLATPIRQGSWVNDPVFRMITSNFSQAQELKLNLEAGALPSDLDVASQSFVQPSYAQKFKPLSLLTGLFAWLTVAGVIFWRYGESRVAIPMLLTAMAEVWILLGFAAQVGLALDFSHIAGLIAVIGTGVDDLVIIADEILQRGEVATGRVFSNRFRKAFWVIGAAAITTIIAMSPLAVLSLGDLQGFAIITIVGVLIGVLVTRPAYGDVLRHLLLEEEEE